MTDRLKDLKRADATKGYNEIDIEADLAGINKASSSTNSAGPAVNMDSFFQEIASYQADMAKIRRNIKLIDETHAASLGATTPQVSKECNDRLEGLMKETSTLIERIKNGLARMDVQTKEMREKNSGSAELRIREGQQQQLQRKFMEVMTDYANIQEKSHTKYKERVARQLKIVKDNVTDEEVDEIIENGDADEIFKQQFLNTSLSTAQVALDIAREQYRDLAMIQTSMAELKQMFIDFAALVAEQDDLFNNISINVSKTREYVEKGVTEIKKAQEYQKAGRKVSCTIIIIIVIVAIVLVVLAVGIPSLLAVFKAI